MEIKINIPDYNGVLQSNWEDGFEIKTIFSNEEIVISANKAGLISLAKQLLTLAQDTVPTGCHFHFDEFNSLEENSKELIIQKL
ncbi:MAG: hypothetical protein EOO91_07140 [Pedobacter sp.]|nr:MAG: hypothetical protein EOO91_07140 [Pedobacter sp.]